MSDNTREISVPFGWVDTAAAWAFKLLWFFIAVMLLIAAGDWVVARVAFPAWVPGWVQTELIAPLPGFLYIMWRFQGGKVKLRDGELVFQWRWRADKTNNSEAEGQP